MPLFLFSGDGEEGRRLQREVAAFGGRRVGDRTDEQAGEPHVPTPHAVDSAAQDRRTARRREHRWPRTSLSRRCQLQKITSEKELRGAFFSNFSKILKISCNGSLYLSFDKKDSN